MLNENKRLISYNKGETVLKQSAFVSHVGYMRSGLAKQVVEGINGKNIIIKFIAENSYFGFPALNSDDYYPFSIVAVNNAEICLFKKEIIHELMKENTLVSSKIVNWYNDDYKYIFNKFAIVGTKQMHGRFAETLLYLAQEQFARQAIYKHITRREIAEFAGMSAESMVRLLQEFKHDKLIEVKGKHIEVKDIAMLKRLSKLG